MHISRIGQIDEVGYWKFFLIVSSGLTQLLDSRETDTNGFSIHLDLIQKLLAKCSLMGL